jgi:hypothetical protein
MKGHEAPPNQFDFSPCPPALPTGVRETRLRTLPKSPCGVSLEASRFITTLTKRISPGFKGMSSLV